MDSSLRESIADHDAALSRTGRVTSGGSGTGDGTQGTPTPTHGSGPFHASAGGS